MCTVRLRLELRCKFGRLGIEFESYFVSLEPINMRELHVSGRQVVSRLQGSALIFMGPRDTKYDSNSIPSPTIFQLNSSCNRTVHIFNTYLTFLGHTTKHLVTECAKKYTWQRKGTRRGMYLPCAACYAYGKNVFAVCCMLCTRQGYICRVPHMASESVLQW